MAAHHTPDDDDADLFRNAIGPVRKLPEAPPPPTPPKPRPRARMAELDEADARHSFKFALDESLLEAADALSYRSEALPVPVFARLKRGEIAVQEELDLHGADVRTAEQLLRAFLNDARQHGVGCVGVIHGKGLHGAAVEGRPVDSRGAPVIKNLVDRMLRQRADVLAFHSAPPTRGGTGAVIVLLAPSKRR
ncbi:Smr/MutS family protein [Lysobacter korlensis]|uniref:Smr/MutS family protein n=1 Tax=Lysobacter korlensis TaxID=553636 RepID=A0ABV6RK80_9GAMM